MFICPVCKQKMILPQCDSCGHMVEKQNNIWQLTQMPDIVTDGDGDKYIGYEYIGVNYSGNRKYLIEQKDYIFAKEISEITGNGIFLDLGCGDGCIAVPCASFGTRIIAGDISNKMMLILQEKALCAEIKLLNVTLCRINALDISIMSGSIDALIANSVLHLISNPQKVVSEIYRILKKGGVFICGDDVPGKYENSDFDNSHYYNIVNSIYNEYWVRMGEQNVFPKKYSWKFNRDELCDSLFSSKSTKLIQRGYKYERSIRDGFLSRFLERGFSDQIGVPQHLHQIVISELMTTVSKKYGNNFADTVYKGVEEDLLITIYKK